MKLKTANVPIRSVVPGDIFKMFGMAFNVWHVVVEESVTLTVYWDEDQGRKNPIIITVKDPLTKVAVVRGWFC